MADEITLERDIDELLGIEQTVEAEQEPAAMQAALEPEDDEDEGSDGEDDEDDEQDED